MAKDKNQNKESEGAMVKKGSTAVMTPEENYEEDSAAGFEKVDQSDFSLAFLGILQTLSKDVEDGTYPKGHIKNSSTSKAVDGELGFFFVPAFRQRLYVEWIPREKGGGRVADYTPEDQVVLKAVEEGERKKTPFDLYVGENHLVETFYMYGIVIVEETEVDNDTGEEITEEIYYEACIPFKSTHIKKYKGWMTELRALKFEKKDGTKANYPLFAHKFHLRTIEQEHSAGKSFNWDINFSGETASKSRLSTNNEYYLVAKGLHKYLTDEGTKVNFTNESKVNSTEDADPEAM